MVLQVLPPCRSGPGRVLSGFGPWMPQDPWHHPMVFSKSAISSSLDSPASQELQLGQFCIFKANGVAAS